MNYIEWAREELKHLKTSEEVSVKLEQAINNFISGAETLQCEKYDFELYLEYVDNLMGGIPLTPLEDGEFDWYEVKGKDKFIKYRHKRYASLVKTDTGKFMDYSLVHPVRVHYGPASDVNGVLRNIKLAFFDKHPIEFPYIPGEGSWRIYFDIVKKDNTIYVGVYKYRNLYTDEFEDVNYFYKLEKWGETVEIPINEFKKVLADG